MGILFIVSIVHIIISTLNFCSIGIRRGQNYASNPSKSKNRGLGIFGYFFSTHQLQKHWIPGFIAENRNKKVKIGVDAFPDIVIIGHRVIVEDLVVSRKKELLESP